GSMASLDTDGDGLDEVVAGFGLGYYTYTGQIEYTTTTPGGQFNQWAMKGTVTAYYGTATGMAVGKFDGLTNGLVVAWDSPGTYALRQLTLFSGTNLTTSTSLTTPSVPMKDVCTIDADFDSSMDWAVTTYDSGISVYKGAGQQN